MQKEPSQGLTGELMLAKGVIEENDKILDQKDEMIRHLASTARIREIDNEEVRGSSSIMLWRLTTRVP